ncbi:hypothetical protein K435DRAFT_971758 [Dendrothele bispora CBS 962.96]|uniref:Heterokaryon incompatibility domain-containing protein n=1 Tax=Dendrothele bispora (strain CBS 962.96) TaxID=1314807 RepID=A0A4S8L3L6_DENBC|nr:hypothetical protein K435DRAFT_971758 [Dendrothele bispora CBS 962.96]
MDLTSSATSGSLSKIDSETCSVYKSTDPVPFMDTSSPIKDLRWIGHHFIYFLNIPWVEGYNHISPEPVSFEDDYFIPLPHDDPQIIQHLRFVSMQALVDFVGEDVIQKYVLVRGPSQEPILSADRLSRLLIPWGRQLCNSSHDTIPVRELSRKLTLTLEKAFTTLKTIVLTTPSIAMLTEPSIDSLFISVGTLMFSLAHWAAAALAISELSVTADSRRMYLELVLLYKRVLNAQWSSNGAGIDRIVVGPGTIPFLAYAAQSVPDINRSKLVDLGNYTPLHVESSCHCVFVKPPVTEVIKLLGEGRFPVVVFDGSKLSVRDWKTEPYVAISHVWADGLGSVTEEGLPMCQLARLATLVKRLVPSGAFWIDSICIPGHKDSRKQAIKLMAATYEQASQVLVIDAGIRTQCTLASSPEECLLRFATSTWMQRIWTLQEGILARSLYFELADGLVDCTHFNGTPYFFTHELLPLFASRPHDHATRSFHALTAKSPLAQYSYGDLIPLLWHRKTSKPADEGLAIAGLLGVDVAELLAESSAEGRMRKLLLLCKNIPRYVPVAGWQGKKLRIPGFRWAPMSIADLSWMGSSNLPDSGTAVCTEEGLLGKYTVVHFAPVRAAGFFTALLATVTSIAPVRAAGFFTALLATVTSNQSSRTSSLSGDQAECVISGVHVELAEETTVGIFEGNLTLTFNGFITMDKDLVNTSSGESPVALVFIPSLFEQNRDASACHCQKTEHLACEFVTTGKMFVDFESAQSLAGRGWKNVEAKMHSLIPVLLT